MKKAIYFAEDVRADMTPEELEADNKARRTRYLSPEKITRLRSKGKFVSNHLGAKRRNNAARELRLLAEAQLPPKPAIVVDPDNPEAQARTKTGQFASLEDGRKARRTGKVDPKILGEAMGMLAQAAPQAIGRMSKIVLPTLYPAQASTKNGSKRFNVVNNGRRSGKTFLGINLASEMAIRGQKVGWFSPTYKLATEAWREICETLRSGIVKQNSTEMRLELQSGGVIEVWTLENENAGRGRKYALVIIDEAAAAPKLKTAWEAAILPTLTDLRGTAWFFSTPAGMNYFYDLAQYAQGPEGQLDWTYWHFPTSINPFIDRDEIELMRRTLPEQTFRQEYLAEFITTEGAVFRNIDPCLKSPITTPEKHVNHVIVGGVDWGRSADFTAISLYCCTCRKEVVLDRFNQISWDFQRGRLLSLCEKWQVRFLHVELNSIGSPLLDRLNIEAPEKITFHGFNTTNKSKRKIIESLGLSFERNQSCWLPDQVARVELLSYEAKMLDGGMIRFSAPDGKHDDTVIARALAWDAARLRMPVEASFDDELEDSLPSTWTNQFVNNIYDPFKRDGYLSARQEDYDELKKTLELKRKPETYYSGETGLYEEGGWEDIL